MKSYQRLVLLGVIIPALSCNRDAASENYIPDTPLVFQKGTLITGNNFTGRVWLENLVVADSSNTNAVGSVTFEAGACSNWHLHPAGQILLAIDGVGYYQEKGQPRRILRKGDVVKCPPGVPHWHGASADTAFVQVAITGREKGETVWMEAVQEEEYHQ